MIYPPTIAVGRLVLLSVAVLVPLLFFADVQPVIDVVSAIWSFVYAVVVFVLAGTFILALAYAIYFLARTWWG